ncbi:hypothetical protein C5167_000740 [Papaver somniferum]|uniref:Uncharacterized protein n=1 Tax=Papaver somniferum TaxID=3469 RepID=A0A4Y7KXC2_PAPSO|nr:hypothetical protein C5167_000740 [Papaver somniferum]
MDLLFISDFKQDVGIVLDYDNDYTCTCFLLGCRTYWDITILFSLTRFHHKTMRTKGIREITSKGVVRNV